MMTTISAEMSDGERQPRDRNLIDTVALVGCMAALTSFSAYQFLSWPGLLAAIVFIALVCLAAANVPPALVMRVYRAMPVDPRNGRDLFAVLEELRQRAGLETRPALYVVPSLTLNAFSTGTPRATAIAVTEGLLRKLSLRQTAGVLAHELSHIRNNDLRIMALADGLSRAMQMLSWLALVLVVLYLPRYLAGDERVPWLGIAVLYLAPTVSTLLQLALARTREFEADRDAAHLTGDPAGLASALRLIERYQGRFWEDLVFPSTRRVPQPSILRTHPQTRDRVERLRGVAPTAGFPPIVVGEDGPRVSLVGMGPSEMRPRYRIPGIWF